ncbi:MAG: transposase [Bradyrhizobium sp.]|nr:transposase [Bradyrhizobium sp.]
MAATACEASERIEIVAERRRAHDAAFRAMVAAEALRPGARVQDVAHRYRVCPSLVYRWRRLAEPGRTMAPTAGFLPITVAPMREPPSAPVHSSAAGRGGTIRIELANGVRVTVDESVSTTALRRVISVLRG